MSSPTSDQQWPTERAFLHSLSTPLSTLGLELEGLIVTLNSLNSDLPELPGAQESVARTQRSLDRVFKMIQARRAQLTQHP